MHRKIHMMDQVGANKIEEIMSHYDRCSPRLWGMKFMMAGIFMLLGVS